MAFFSLLCENKNIPVMKCGNRIAGLGFQVQHVIRGPRFYSHYGYHFITGMFFVSHSKDENATIDISVRM